MKACLIVDRRMSIIICMSLLLSAGISTAKTPTRIKAEDVIRVLKSHSDPTPDDFMDAGSGVGGTLADLLGRGRLDVELRLRAARALGRYPCEKTSVVLGTAVSDKDGSTVVRVAAMLGLARAEGTKAISVLSEFLKNESEALRTGSVIALSTIGGKQVRELLTNAMHNETVLEVRLAIDKALEKMR